MKRNAVKKEMQDRLDNASRKIDSLTLTARQNDEDSKVIHVLQEQRDALAEAIESLERDTTAASDDFTQRIDEGLGSLETRLNSVKPQTGTR